MDYMVKTAITDIEIGKNLKQLQKDVDFTKTELHKLNSRLETVETRVNVVEEVNSNIQERSTQFEIRLNQLISEQRQALILKWVQLGASVVIVIILLKAIIP